jgi:hypothetical protein
VTAAGVAMGFALFLILLVATFTLGFLVYRALGYGETVDPYLGRSGTTATVITGSSDNAGGGGGGSTSSEPVMAIRPWASSASSILEPTITSNFRPPNLVDDDLTTAWSEGKDGPGTGEWVRFEFLEPIVVDHLEIANGYQKDDERFFATARVEALKLEFSNGATQLVELLDTKDLQSITTPHRATDWIKLTIVSVFPDYEWDNASLSEIRIYAVSDGQ